MHNLIYMPLEEVVPVLFRMWFWVKAPTDDSTSHFNLERDSIYGATILLGAGGATILVISMAMISYLVGSYTVSIAALVYIGIQTCLYYFVYAREVVPMCTDGWPFLTVYPMASQCRSFSS